MNIQTHLYITSGTWELKSEFDIPLAKNSQLF